MTCASPMLPHHCNADAKQSVVHTMCMCSYVHYTLYIFAHIFVYTLCLSRLRMFMFTCCHILSNNIQLFSVWHYLYRNLNLRSE